MPKSGSRRKKTRTHVDDPKKMEELELKNEEQIRNKIDTNNNMIVARFDDSFSSHSTDSSFNEVQEIYMKDLMNLWISLNSNGNSNINENSEVNDQEQWVSKEYLYPKLVWDQNSTFVTLNVLLKNVTDFTVNYLETSLSFR